MKPPGHASRTHNNSAGGVQGRRNGAFGAEQRVNVGFFDVRRVYAAATGLRAGAQVEAGAWVVGDAEGWSDGTGVLDCWTGLVGGCGV